MKYQGKVAFRAAPADIWRVALDIEQFAECMPGVRDVVKIDDRSFEGGMSAKVGPVSGDFTFRAEIVEADEPVRLVARVEGQDSLTKSAMTASIEMTLAATEGGCELAYASDVAIKGRLGIVGDMILRATGMQVIEEFFNRLRAKVEPPASPAC